MLSSLELLQTLHDIGFGEKKLSQVQELAMFLSKNAQGVDRLSATFTDVSVDGLLGIASALFGKNGPAPAEAKVESKTVAKVAKGKAHPRGTRGYPHPSQAKRARLLNAILDATQIGDVLDAHLLVDIIPPEAHGPKRHMAGKRYVAGPLSRRARVASIASTLGYRSQLFKRIETGKYRRIA